MAIKLCKQETDYFFYEPKRAKFYIDSGKS